MDTTPALDLIDTAHRLRHELRALADLLDRANADDGFGSLLARMAADLDIAVAKVADDDIESRR